MPNASQPRLLSFTLGGWIALGEKVSVSLVDQVAVLVGRNGAGKSAILEGFEAISSAAVGRFRWTRQFDIERIPTILDVEILTPTNRRLHYHYELEVVSTSNDYLDLSIDDSTTEILEENIFVWNDSCQYIDEAQEHLWSTEMGMTAVRDRDFAFGPVGGGTSLLLRAKSRADLGKDRSLLEEMHWVYVVLSGVRLLGKTPIRQTYSRRQCLLQISGKRILSTSSLFYGKIDSLARKIFRLKTEDLNEFESICQRVGLVSKITLQKFVLKEEFREGTRDEEYVISVSLDGVNIGLLSDGTLRVLSLLIELITSHPSVTTIIEEPETQIHPGMLAKLLNEIKAYTFGENLIVSTHSPQVVTWTSPDKINLVYRNSGKTIVRKLDEEEIQQVVDYLYEEGNLGEWLYSGILDE